MFSMLSVACAAVVLNVTEFSSVARFGVQWLATAVHRQADALQKLAALAIVLWLAQLGFAERVDMEVRNPGGVAAQQWPMTTGVPFPPGALRSADEVRLLSADGGEIPAQVACTGKHEDGSVRWLLLDFQADMPKAGSRGGSRGQLLTFDILYGSLCLLL